MIRLDTAVRKGVETTLLNLRKIRAFHRSTAAPSGWTCTARTRWRPARRRSESSKSPRGRSRSTSTRLRRSAVFRRRARSVCRLNRSGRSSSPRCGWRTANGSAACAPPADTRCPALHRCENLRAAGRDALARTRRQRGAGHRDHRAGRTAAEVSPLTPQQREIAELAASGLTENQIHDAISPPSD